MEKYQKLFENKEILDIDLPNFTPTKYLSFIWKTYHCSLYFFFAFFYFISEIINIKKKNNLDDNVQIGTLFHMKSKFNFKMFNNVEFIECDKKSEYNSLIKRMKEILENKNIN